MRRAFRYAVAASLVLWVAVAIERHHNHVKHTPLIERLTP